jgi:hypothetical protein
MIRRAHIKLGNRDCLHREARESGDKLMNAGFDESAVELVIGESTFLARWENELAPGTCAAFKALLPYTQRIIHVRWSGEACWIPLGGFQLGVGPENPVGRPSPGQLLFYPGGISETEILLPYGATRFSSVAGDLAGNRLLTITEGLDELAKIGREVLWNGSRQVVFREIKST